MGFLDSIGHGRTGSQPPSSPPPVTQSVVQNDSPSTVQKPPAPERQPSVRNDRIIAVGVVLVIIGAVAVAAWLALRGSGAVLTSQTEQTEVSADADAAPAATAAAETVAAKPRSARSVPTIRSAAKNKRTVDSDARRDAAGEAASAVVAASTTLTASLTQTATPPLETVSNLLESRVVAGAPEDDNVYSGEGDGVIAPRLRSLGFVNRAITGQRTRTSTIELVVSKSGDVERVKLFPPSRNWEDAMLLSRAKMFQFQPAQRNGFPVRYRFVMEVDAAP